MDVFDLLVCEGLVRECVVLTELDNQLLVGKVLGIIIEFLFLFLGLLLLIRVIVQRIRLRLLLWRLYFRMEILFKIYGLMSFVNKLFFV